MLKFSILALISMILLPISSTAYAESARNTLNIEQNRVGTKVFTAASYKPGTIQHIVLFRFKDGVSTAQIDEVKQRFLALKGQAKRNGKPYIARIDAGTQNSGEGVSRGYQRGFIVTFRSEGDRNYYVGNPVVTNSHFYDPAHQRFKDFVGPLLAEQNGVLVFDFKTK